MSFAAQAGNSLSFSLPFSNIANFVSSKLDSTNYLVWKDQFESILITTDLCGHVTGDDLEPIKEIVVDGVNTVNPHSDVNGVKVHSEVWEMLDYGIQESWTKRYVVAHESIIIDQKYFRLVRSLKNDEILLLTGNILVLNEPKHGKALELKINNVPFKNAETYFESLVSLNSGPSTEGKFLTNAAKAEGSTSRISSSDFVVPVTQLKVQQEQVQ
ncbi:uncharacterized protein LOC113280630 [Papaver somniferum]|uniref:uncharacterized protein LOC113280630 n=1 Tax=Papaver somniferum TaxID=3469 RepID=UPI000E6F637C|nr:uncharacterized protein LOC113280630 [Papaver somniferum]